jgi:hypothetical protein
MDVVQVWFVAILIFSLLFAQKKIIDYTLCFAFFYYWSSNIIAVVGIFFIYIYICGLLPVPLQ